MPLFSVLIPTYNHQDTLYAAISSIRKQTVQDFEVLVIGDGAPVRTREIIAEISAADPRVKYFEHPKGERHGEAYRDKIIRNAQSPYICYLGDDDLWLPNHLEVVLQALQQVDFVHTLHLRVRQDGDISARLFNLNSPMLREKIKSCELTGFGMSYGSHTREAYLALTQGWETTPKDIATDLYMWSKFAREPHLSCASVLVPTCLHFGAPDRKTETPKQRLAELEVWLSKIGEVGFEHDLRHRISYLTFFEPLLNTGDRQADNISELLALHNLRVELVTSTFGKLEQNSTTATVAMNNDQFLTLETAFLAHRGQLDSATVQQRWQELLQRRSWESEIRLALAKSLFEEAKWQDVVELLSVEVYESQSSVSALHLLANTLIQQGEFGQSEQLIVKGLRRFPNHVGLLLLQASIKIKLNQFEAALTILQTALAEDSQRVGIYRKLGSLYLRLEDFSSAISAYQQAITLEPQNAKLYLKLGSCYFQQGNYPDALVALKQALALDCTLAEAYVFKCRTLKKLNRTKEVQEIVKKGLKYCPGHPKLRKMHNG